MSARTTKPQTGDLFPIAERVELVEVIHDQPMTDTRRIAQMFGKSHKNVLLAVRRLLPDLPEDFTRLNFEPSEYTDSTGRRLPAYLLTQDGFLMLAMGFTGKEAVHWRARFIKAFNTLARTLQRQQRALLSAERLRVRAEVAREHSSMNDVLVEVRRAAGKTTEAHHLANEARLIGYAVTGVVAGLDRDTLDADQLKLLHKVECRNMILIAQGTDYSIRKEALRALVLQEQPAPDDPAGAAPLPQIGGDA